MWPVFIGGNLKVDFTYETKHAPGDLVWVARRDPLIKACSKIGPVWYARRYRIERIDIHFDTSMYGAIYSKDDRVEKHTSIIYYLRDSRQHLIAIYDEAKIHATKEECDIEARANAEKEHANA